MAKPKNIHLFLGIFRTETQPPIGMSIQCSMCDQEATVQGYIYSFDGFKEFMLEFERKHELCREKV